MSDARVSCIMPVYNGEQYLAEALDSVLAQETPVHEIIVVDDGSTDGTSAVVRRYGERVRYIAQSNAGASVARNRGLDAAAGDFIAFLDADDYWHQAKVTRQLARFAARPELDYSVTHVQNFWVSELAAEAEHYQGHRRSRPIAGYVTGTMMVKRAAFHRIGGFNPTLKHADDTDWFLRADAAGAVGELMPDVLLYRRIHPENISRTRGSASREEYLRLLKATLDRRRKNAL
jgi:glycosyltransferase involved in cell wall biosynthesis